MDLKLIGQIWVNSQRAHPWHEDPDKKLGCVLDPGPLSQGVGPGAKGWFTHQDQALRA